MISLTKLKELEITELRENSIDLAALEKNELEILIENLPSDEWVSKIASFIYGLRSDFPELYGDFGDTEVYNGTVPVSPELSDKIKQLLDHKDQEKLP